MVPRCLLPLGDSLGQILDHAVMAGREVQVLCFPGIVSKVVEFMFSRRAQRQFPAVGRHDGSYIGTMNAVDLLLGLFIPLGRKKPLFGH